MSLQIPERIFNLHYRITRSTIWSYLDLPWAGWYYDSDNEDEEGDDEVTHSELSRERQEEATRRKAFEEDAHGTGIVGKIKEDGSAGEDDVHFTKDDYLELDMFRKQERLRLLFEARREEFKNDIIRQQEAFIESENLFFKNLMLPIAHQLLHSGIDKTRESMVPAYTFTKFGLLPVEIQMRIWSMAARVDDPQVHIITSMEYDKRVVGRCFSPQGARIDGSSRIRKITSKYHEIYKVPVTQQICINSQRVTQGIYTQLPLFRGSTYHDLPDSYAYSSESNDGDDYEMMVYVNILYDVFYFFGSSWDQFKVLVDLMIRLNTTRPLLDTVREELEALLKIRHVAVDFNVFASAPPRVWAEFPNLETLTIVVYPYRRIAGADHRGELQFAFPEHIRFIEPSNGSILAKRTAWAAEAARKTFSNVQKELPRWKMPEIKAATRRIHDYINQLDIDQVCDQIVGDDSEWYAQAEKRMTHVVSPTEIKKLKHTFLPSRVVIPDGLLHYMGEFRDLSGMRIEYEPDSEGEEGIEAVKAARRRYFGDNNRLVDHYPSRDSLDLF